MPDLWSGRLPGGLDPKARAFSSSLAVDWRLARYDIQGSLAHADMLAAVGLLTPEEHEAIQQGLEALLSEVEAGADPWDLMAEDVHSAVEQELTRRLGPVAGKLHTARSRNDQVALDLHLYVKDAGQKTIAALNHLVDTILGLAERWADLPLPGYTHMQPGQPVTVGHHLLAYVWMLLRDRSRIEDMAARANVSPLGAGALAGTTLPIDPTRTAHHLGFAGPYQNSLDAVSDRDFAIEFLADLALVAVHLSRLSEELILWSGREFGFITLSDHWATGSSMMPQKKNPDIAELIRGKSGVVIGQLTAFLTLMKGLPLAYNRDLQEDKGLLFTGVDTVLASLDAMAGLLAGITVNPKRIQEDMGEDLLATDWAEKLVQDGIPFREAHGQVAARFRDPQVKAASPDAIRHSLTLRDRPMGPGPAHVREQIRAARQLL
ncbi:argininosuccinate lyase [Sulfobacillus acidophilus TPY]|uniref:Argininosuccinate lyase n=1 Tax=Sulfobacillus acidophilus (strain ATCC 700253 / DSM 10332 / NAL) TaxID=679936 RepID=G8TS31_SULAD|nr:argininosuccinate lyase [Sulfobacillus acidophilus TPY]AEW04357.1 Argininosuccinate lyase [Sulfobacillus acidophilus DSM 10332]